MDPGHGPVRTDARMSGNLGCIAPSGTRWSAQSHHRKPPANQTKGRGRGGSERKPAWKPKTRPTAHKSRNEAPGQARAQKMEDPRNVPFAHFPSSSASTIPSSSYPPLHRPSCPKLVSRNALGCSVPSGTLCTTGDCNLDAIPQSACGAFRVAVSLRFMRSWGAATTTSKKT